jgi:putative NADPH-quinone reductase
MKISWIFCSIVILLSAFALFAHKKNESLKVQPMHVYAVFGNDNVSGMSQSLLTTATDIFVQAGHTVDLLKLYDRVSEIPYFMHGRQNFDAFPFYAENQQRFLKADVLLLVFPVYWYSTPAIVKNWIDLLTGWSYTYESGQYAQAKHNIKKVIILYSCAQEKLDKNSMSIVEQQLFETFKFIGIDEITMYGIDNVYGLTPETTIKHFDAVKKICESIA